MGRFGILRLALFPFTSTSTARSLSTTRLASARRQFVQLATLSWLASSLATHKNTLASSTTARMMASSPSDIDLGYLDATSAATLDEELMSQPGFTLEQLMELAGLSVAEAAYNMLSSGAVQTKILVICGPGNNGGDGLVAARHLHHFGYETVVVYPKRSSRQPHYANLVQQCHDLDIPVWDEMPQDLSEYGLVLDSIFGFSFKGEPREPFRTIIEIMNDMQSDHGARILSVDVPSGWNVDKGDINQSGFLPDAVISLTAPKECMRTYQGTHFVGGRFLPPALAAKYNVRMPPYPGVAQVLQITRGGAVGQGDIKTSTGDDAWQAGYAAYCAAKEAKLARKDGDVEVEPWQVQYAAHCAEKEAALAEKDRVEERAKLELSWEAQYAAHTVPRKSPT